MTDLTPNQIKQAIKTEVFNLGFLLNGFTTPAPLQEFELFDTWIRRGYHAEMRYLARQSAMEKRKNPCLVFPAVKSILVLGIPYPPPRDTDHSAFAAYAQGPDYHNLILEKLSGFQSWLEDLVTHEVQLKIFTDTAPIMEKALAVRAGLGWIGKNGLVIHPEYGSYFFLTEIFLDLDLPPDQPFSDELCGTCNRCVEHCPTSAILPGRLINSNLCLSYLTIEKKGPFTEQETRFIRSSLFGCDQCQITCPWNKKIAKMKSNTTLFEPDERFRTFSKNELLLMNQEQFNAWFRHTPVSRVKRQSLLRNLLAFITNTGNTTDIATLQTFIDLEENENLRMMAIHAQAEIIKRNANKV
jgi:epoxyqueuosine reductase